MYFKESREETRSRDKLISALDDNTSEIIMLIESLRASLDEARQKIEELEEELDGLR